MKLYKNTLILIVIIVIFGILAETDPQAEQPLPSSSEPIPTPTPTPTSTSVSKNQNTGIVIFGVFGGFSVVGLIILINIYLKGRVRKDLEITSSKDTPNENASNLSSTDDRVSKYSSYQISEKSITMQPSTALTTNHYNDLNLTKNRDFVPKNEKTIDLTPQQNYNLNQPVIRPFSPVKVNCGVSIPNNTKCFDNNNLSKSSLNDKRKGFQALNNSSTREKKYEDPSICGEPNSDNSIVIGPNCIYRVLSSTQTFGHTYDLLFSLNKTNSLQLKLKKDQNDSSTNLLNNTPYNLPYDVPAELYIDKFTIAGQGTIGLKFQAKDRFRIVLNSNTDQSYGRTNVIVLDVGEDVTYFRKRNNDDPIDILALTKDQRALLNKNMVQLYWLSLDKKNRRLRYGKGSMQSLLSTFFYNFPPKPSKGIDEYEWIEKLNYVAITGVTFQKKDFIENKPKIELTFSNLPVTMDLPPTIIKREESTMEELESGRATVIDNLPKECKELYWNIISEKVTLNNSDFPDFADAIEYSINTPGLTCYEKLKEKAGGFGDKNPKNTYLRVTLGEDQGNSPGVPYVLEIWPSGHYSPIHSHSNSFGIIKVLYNEIVSRFFTELQPQDQEWYYEVTFKEGEVTWISDKLYQTHQLWNRTRKVCCTIQCYRYGEGNLDHYEFFDYIDNRNIVKQFRPNTDWGFAEFKRLIRKEWNRYKYLSDRSPGTKIDQITQVAR